MVCILRGCRSRRARCLPPFAKRLGAGSSGRIDPSAVRARPRRSPSREARSGHRRRRADPSPRRQARRDGTAARAAETARSAVPSRRAMALGSAVQSISVFSSPDAPARSETGPHGSRHRGPRSLSSCLPGFPSESHTSVLYLGNIVRTRCSFLKSLREYHANSSRIGRATPESDRLAPPRPGPRAGTGPVSGQGGGGRREAGGPGTREPGRPCG